MWLLKKFCFIFKKKNLYSSASTIFAVSSGKGKCGVAVIRISGPKAKEAIFKMTKLSELPKPRMASLHHIQDPDTFEELDKGLILWFPGPKSFTGEDCCEFQIHGGPAVIYSVLSGLSKIPDFKPAEAGDFTKRAFFAGKLDLVEVEGLGDLIHAETELQRKQALYQMEGHLSLQYKKWKKVLIKNLAHVEAYIDFSEDENIEENVLHAANKDLLKLKNEIKNHLCDDRKGQRLRDGVQTIIVGEPNVGKSSLLNAISQKPAAIVTPMPGTTRDIIEICLNVSGYPIVLADTAGLRENTTSVVEKEGIKRAREFMNNSDLILLVIDATKLVASAPAISPKTIVQFLKNHIKDLNLNIEVEKVLQGHVQNNSSFVFVVNKIDLLSEKEKNTLKEASENIQNLNYLSCQNKEGFAKFLKNLSYTLENLCGNPSRESPSITQARHRAHLNKCHELLGDYLDLADRDAPLAAQKLRLALRQLGKVIGTVTTEQILDVIFSDFCIGK